MRPLLVATALLSTFASGVPPRPSAQATAAAPAASDWRDRALSPGDWRYAAGTARFGTSSDALVMLQCDRAGQAVWLNLRGGSGAMMVRTTSITRTLGPASGAVRLDPRDPLLDAMGYSRGRVAIEQGAAMAIVPAWAEILRVVEDCRA